MASWGASCPGQIGYEGFYTKKGKTLKIGKAEIEPVKYGFYENKFYKGIIEYKSVSHFNKLKEKLEEELESGKQSLARY